MASNIISVRYKSKWGENVYGDPFSYRTTLEDVQPGDWVIAPTAYGAKEARVERVDIPESDVPAHILPVLKTVTRRREDVGNV